MRKTGSSLPASQFDAGRAHRFDRGRPDLRDLARDRGLSHRRDRDQAARQRGHRRQGPSLFQRYSLYGDPDLAPEKSFGVDAGVDQKLFNDRATVSATVFDTKYQNLIYFADVSSCTAAQVSSGGGCYYNIGRAQTSGVEFSADVSVVPDVWRLHASYTYLNGQNLPRHTIAA